MYPTIFLGNRSKNGRHAQAFSHSASNLLRRSFGRLPFAGSNHTGYNISVSRYDSTGPQPDDNLDMDYKPDPVHSETSGSILKVCK